MEKIKARDYRLDNIRGMMILGIVFEHSLLIYGYPRSHEIVWSICISWLMPMFTMISGYLFKVRSIKEMCKRYLYPMILFSTVNFLIGYFFYPAYRSGIHWIGYAMWYLWALLIMTIITPPILKKLNYKIVLLFIAVAMIYQVLPFPPIANYVSKTLQINRIVGFYPFFLIGILLRRDIVKIENMVSRMIYTLVLLSILSMYAVACWLVPGLAYKSGFYLAFSSGLETTILTAGSYVVIVLICLLLLLSVSRKQKWYSKYGTRTMNVYVLHMIVVFPICYGIFAHLAPSLPFRVLNSLLAVVICLMFFSNPVNKVMQALLSNPRWGYVLIVYSISLCLVNWQVLNHFSKMFLR